MRQAGKFKDYEILQISIQGEGKGLMAAAAELKKKNPQCLLMFCNTVNAYDLIQELKKNRLYLPLYSPIFIADENYDAFIKIRNSGYRVGIPAIRLHPSEFSSFAKNYEMEFGRQPGFSAALAYDAVRLLVEAIRNSGPEREKLQSYLLKCNYDGITGIIKFDELGNRLSIPGLVEI
jgi:ABC-type branched-subunit amino acid transport system substrate-binding protein